MKAEDRLQLSAIYLARRAPREWQDFLDALSVYATQQKDNLTQSPLDALQVNQGRAQNAARVHKLLTEALQSADKLESKIR